MITSGSSPAIAICSIASWPITVWWSSTKSNTEPSEYFVPGWVTVSSIASLMAMPSEPVWSGVLGEDLLAVLRCPATGLGDDRAP